MEFADYRDYAPGDDTRRLDAPLYARTGELYIREYEVTQQLAVSIFIDASRSMEHGAPRKFDSALWLASTLGFVGLAGGDRVQLAIGTRNGVRWSRGFSGPTAAPHMFAWMRGARPDHGARLGASLGAFAQNVPLRSLAILISDFWLEESEAAIHAAAARGAEIWALHVLAKEEVDPQGAGPMTRLVDSESGEELLLGIDSQLLTGYRREFEAFRDQLKNSIEATGGRYFFHATEDDLESMIPQRLRSMGLLRQR
jgi:uncharacterized protein (DUF58 family)